MDIHMQKKEPQSLSHVLLKINSKCISSCQGLTVGGEADYKEKWLSKLAEGEFCCLKIMY